MLEQLRDIGIEISSGQLNNIITENLEEFHSEKSEILKAGLENPDFIQTDDTGARHKGINGYCTQIGNDFFTWFESTQSKSRINFLELLSNGVEKSLYTFNSISRAYMQEKGLSSKWLSELENVNISIDSKDEFNHALCWIHAERAVNRLIPLTDKNKILFESAREDIWNIYQKLKEYKENPTSEMKDVINTEFDKFSTKITGYEPLDKAIKQSFKNNKVDLLKVLEQPNLPLHNNLSERDIRDYVKKRKISGSTRSENGRKARDTFASLKKTCKKLEISFLEYLNDRIFKIRKIDCLGDRIRAIAY